MEGGGEAVVLMSCMVDSVQVETRTGRQFQSELLRQGQHSPGGLLKSVGSQAACLPGIMISGFFGGSWLRGGPRTLGALVPSDLLGGSYSWLGRREGDVDRI